jgi:hypothetical protein
MKPTQENGASTHAEHYAPDYIANDLSVYAMQHTKHINIYQIICSKQVPKVLQLQLT